MSGSESHGSLAPDKNNNTTRSGAHHNWNPEAFRTICYFCPRDACIVYPMLFSIVREQVEVPFNTSKYISIL
jgi:hypothetical protein